MPVPGRGLVRDARTWSRYARRLPSFLRGRVTPEQAREEIERRLRAREEAFLDVLERGVFAAGHSPYRPLFAAAGAELGDVRAMVAAEGLEGALPPCSTRAWRCRSTSSSSARTSSTTRWPSAT